MFEKFPSDICTSIIKEEKTTGDPLKQTLIERVSFLTNKKKLDRLLQHLDMQFNKKNVNVHKCSHINTKFTHVVGFQSLSLNSGERTRRK